MEDVKQSEIVPFQSLFYWITYSYFSYIPRRFIYGVVSILILLDYLFLFRLQITSKENYIVSILILLDYLFLSDTPTTADDNDECFNPYFTGLPILIIEYGTLHSLLKMFQSLFYWITYSYHIFSFFTIPPLSVSILILLDYLFLYGGR